MELIVFWLMPVLLLIVLIFLTLQITKDRKLAKLYAVEPLELLIKGWQVARFEPDNQTIKRIFKLLAMANLSKGTLLEQVIVSAARSFRLQSKAMSAMLVEHRSIGPLAEQFILETSAKNQSVLIGPLEQIEELVDDEKIAKYRHLSQKSTESGYLSLTVATSFIHGSKQKSIRHQIEGLVILEPVIDEKQLAKLQNISQELARFLTVLPVGLATHLYNQVFPDQAHFSVQAKELETILPPKFAEVDLDKARVVGGADLVARHQALRVWQRRFSCVLVSRNPEDRDLPVNPVTELL